MPGLEAAQIESSLSSPPQCPSSSGLSFVSSTSRPCPCSGYEVHSLAVELPTRGVRSVLGSSGQYVESMEGVTTDFACSKTDHFGS
jgi:hypothetical protein